jgi:hypothetical protein
VVKMSEAIANANCQDGLRLRRCCDPACNAVFAICRTCDRGQRYCTSPSGLLAKPVRLCAVPSLVFCCPKNCPPPVLEVAQVLYGVTLQGPGVSKLVSMKFEPLAAPQASDRVALAAV